MKKKRCAWVKGTGLELETEYHDNEWGNPVHDDHKLFELLILEGAQAGLSWSIILKKRAAYREAFDNFNPEIISKYDEQKKKQLLENRNIVRNKLKIDAAINNAKAFTKIQHVFGSFNSYIWQFTNGRVIQNSWKSFKEVPTSTQVSDSMSRDLKQKGFKFVGSKICYAYMQAIGIVNDHTIDCYKHSELMKNN